MKKIWTLSITFLLVLSLGIGVFSGSSSSENVDLQQEEDEEPPSVELYDFSDHLHVNMGKHRYNFHDEGTVEVLDRDNNTLLGYMRSDLQREDKDGKWNDKAVEFMQYSYNNYTDENGLEAYRVNMTWGDDSYDSTFNVTYDLEWYRSVKIGYYFLFDESGNYRTNWHMSDIRLGSYNHTQNESRFYDNGTPELIINWTDALDQVDGSNISTERTADKVDVWFGLGEFQAGERFYLDPFVGGSGTESDPYEITNLTELQSINDELDAHYILMNDINASETKDWNDGNGFEPIGDDENKFTGSFDGQGYTISDLYINRNDELYIGLFGWPDGATIENIGVEDVDVSGDSRVGSLVGYNSDSEVSNSYSTGDVNGNDRVGGLVGLNWDSEVSNSYSTGNVSGDSRVGGLVGRNRNSEVSNSYSTGNVSGEGIRVGGLVGVVYNTEGETDEILYSYANSDINPDLDLIGVDDISGTLDTTGSKLLTTAEMTDYENDYPDAYEGWDFDTTWKATDWNEDQEGNEGYPALDWEDRPPEADFTYDPSYPGYDQEIQFFDDSTEWTYNITKYEWEMGDGTTYEVENPSHTYDQVGSFNVTLTVTDEVNETDSITKMISTKGSMVESVQPENNAIDVGIDTDVVVSFNTPMNTSKEPVLTQEWGTIVAYEFQGWEDDQTARWDHTGWQYGETIILNVTNYESENGREGDGTEWHFTVETESVDDGGGGVPSDPDDEPTVDEDVVIQGDTFIDMIIPQGSWQIAVIFLFLFSLAAWEDIFKIRTDFIMSFSRYLGSKKNAWSTFAGVILIYYGVLKSWFPNFFAEIFELIGGV